MIPESIAMQLFTGGVAAVLTIDDPGDAVEVASALMSGGIGSMELTLRTDGALDALREIRQGVPEMLAGVGTILTPQQLYDAALAGAAFGVSPGCNPPVVRAAAELGLPFAPGVVTPTDIESAMDLGCQVLKFFPAEESGGVSYLNSMAAPYAHMRLRYIPLGGVNMSNLARYLTNPHVLAVGGSWLAPRDLIASKDWGAIEQRAREARQLVDSLDR